MLSDLSLEELKEVRSMVAALLDYSSAAIIRNNFIESFYKFTHNGRLHGNYRLGGAKSFRLTSNNPNMLNAPSTGSIYAKPIKRCFVAEPNHIFYMVDYAALEDRIIANLSRDKNKCAVFIKGMDGHCLNANVYFKEEVEKELPRKENEDDVSYIKRFHEEVENGNKKLKAIRQKGKSPTFALNYGCKPRKLSEITKMPLKEAEKIWKRFHEDLYPDIDKMTRETLSRAKKEGRINLGLGWYINTSNPERDLKTLFNAQSQFWSILTLLTINKLNKLVDEHGYTDKVEVVSSIYDSIYIHMECEPSLICWLNKTIIPIMVSPCFEDMIVPLEDKLS